MECGLVNPLQALAFVFWNACTSHQEPAFAGCTSLKTIYSLVSTPATVAENCFPSESKNGGMLYVPAGTRSLYETTPGWDFKNIVEMDGGQGIHDIQSGKGEIAKDECGFDLQGRRLSGTPGKELYIRNGRKTLKK